MGWPLVYTHSIIFTHGPRLIKYSNFLNFKETPQESDVNPISKYQTRQVCFNYIMRIFCLWSKILTKRFFKTIRKSFSIFRFEKSCWRISLIRKKFLHNVIKANLSRMQFCNLINNSQFCETLLTSKTLNVSKWPWKRCHHQIYYNPLQGIEK